MPFEKATPDLRYVDHVIYPGENRVQDPEGAGLLYASVAMGCLHPEEIRVFHTDLIEMESAASDRMADLMEVPGVALLVVSDSSSSGDALVGRTEAQQRRYAEGQRRALPRLILAVAGNGKMLLCDCRNFSFC